MVYVETTIDPEEGSTITTGEHTIYQYYEEVRLEYPYLSPRFYLNGNFTGYGSKNTTYDYIKYDYNFTVEDDYTWRIDVRNDDTGEWQTGTTHNLTVNDNVFAEGTKTVTAAVIVDYTTGPGKARFPDPVDDKEDVRVRGIDTQKRLAWSAPSGETPDYKFYFREYGGAWVLYDTIAYIIAPSYTLLPSIAFDYYTIYEWRVDTYDPETELTTTGDTWTFVSEPDIRWTEYTRRSDYNADKVWQPGTGWVDINSLEFTGGGRFKNRILVVGHKVLYFGDI